MERKHDRVDKDVHLANNSYFEFIHKLSEEWVMKQILALDCLVLQRKVASLFYWDRTGIIREGEEFSMPRIKKLASEFQEREMCTCFTEAQVIKGLRSLRYGLGLAKRRGTASSAGSEAIYSLGSFELNEGFCPVTRERTKCQHCVGLLKESTKGDKHES